MSKRAKLINLYSKGHTQKTAGDYLLKDGTKTNRQYRYKIYREWKSGKYGTAMTGPITPEKPPQPVRGKKSPLKLKIAGEKTSPDKLRIITPETPEGEIPTPSAMLFTWEDCSYIFEGINGLIPEKRQPSEKSTKLLGKLWYKPINNLIEKYSDKNPLLVIAVLISVAIYAPCVIGVVQDWREKKEKEKKKVKEKEASKKE